MEYLAPQLNLKLQIQNPKEKFQQEDMVYSFGIQILQNEFSNTCKLQLQFHMNLLGQKSQVDLSFWKLMTKILVFGPVRRNHFPVRRAPSMRRTGSKIHNAERPYAPHSASVPRPPPSAPRSTNYTQSALQTLLCSSTVCPGSMLSLGMQMDC